MWSIIEIIANTKINSEDLFWQEWRDILLVEYNGRLTALGAKGYRTGPERKIFTAIFLQVKGFSLPAPDILPEAIKIIEEKDTIQPDNQSSAKEYDAIAMMGHRIGMLENSAGLTQYLQDVRPVLKSEGQILLTALDVGAIQEPERRSGTVINSLRFQQANLIGPFFVLLRIKTGTLKSQTAAANWQCEIIYRQDESNYLARLSPCESGAD